MFVIRSELLLYVVGSRRRWYAGQPRSVALISADGLGDATRGGVVESFERGNLGGTVGFVAFLTSLEPIGWRVGVSSMAGH